MARRTSLTAKSSTESCTAAFNMPSPDVEADHVISSGDDDGPASDSYLEQTLYEVLSVPLDASEAAIRRSYYLAARELHPDKNPDDPQATKKFQRVSDAYQVLSNPESRVLYDRHGMAGLEKSAADAVDPSTLFAIVFGSDQFTLLIGELRLTSLASNVDEDGNAPPQDVLDELQDVRVQKLATGMIDWLRPWVLGNRAEFVTWAEEEVGRLCEANFGTNLLQTVGTVYVHRVDISVGKTQMFGIPALIRDASYRTHKLGAQIKANAATNKVMTRQRRLHDRVKKLNRDGGAISEVEAKEVATKMARNAVDMMWKISVLDIQTTLESVIERVLSGDDVSREDEVDFREQLLASRADVALGSSTPSNHSIGMGARVGSSRQVDAADSTRAQIVSERAAGIRMFGKCMLTASRRARASIADDPTDSS
jgi:X-domain of DnaJ-containing/DnaJ domain